MAFLFSCLNLMTISDILGKISDLWQQLLALIAKQPVLFLSIGGGVLLLFLILIITGINRRTRRHSRQDDQFDRQVVTRARSFVPVETPDAEIEAEYLTLREKIIAADGHMGRRLVEKIKNRGPQALDDLIFAYDKAGPEVREQIRQLVKQERLMERYAGRLNRADYPQGVLVEAWQRFPNPEALRQFVEMLASPDESLQIAGTRFLSALREPQSLTPLAAALMWPEHFVPARVAEVFSALGAPGARLLAYLLPQVDDKHKVRVLDTIAKIGAAYPPENVAACLKHQDPAIRASAALALGAGRMVAALQPLMISASDKTWQVRAAVAKALGMIGDQRALPVLEMLAKDQEGWVAKTAQKTLELFAKA